MNSDSGLVPTNISDVIDKFNQSIRKFAIKETEWFIQKGNYDIKIAELEGQLKAHENINMKCNFCDNYKYIERLNNKGVLENYCVDCINKLRNIK